MTIRYKIFPDLEILYIGGTGNVTTDEITTTGAKVFAESEWTNGFNILIDYREISKFEVKAEGVHKIINQDKANKHLFDQSKCAIVADSDLVYGLSRMWEILSEDSKIPTMIFRNIEDALQWLGLDRDSERLPREFCRP